MTTALPIKQGSRADPQKRNQQTRRPSIHPLTPPYGTMNVENGSPMSFGMSFGGAGGMMKSWKQSFQPGSGLAMQGISYGAGQGFGSYRNASGSFMGYVDDSMDADPIFNTGNETTISFSFTGRNGSFRSPSALGIPIALGSFNGGQSFGGMSFTGKSLTGSSANWGKVKSNIMQKEADFCKDFMCCGKDLGNLHDLLEHYEEAHVVVVDSPGASQLDLSVEMDPDSKWAYGGDDMDVEMEALDEESPSSSSGSETATSSTQTSPTPEHALPGLLPTSSGAVMSSAMKKLALEDVIKASITGSSSSGGSSSEMSAFDSFVISSPPKVEPPHKSKSSNIAVTRRALHGGVNGHRNSTTSNVKSAFGLNVRTSPEPVKRTTGFDAVPPNILFTAGPGTQTISAQRPETFGAEPEVEDTESGSKGPGWKVPNADGTQSDVNPQPSLFSTHRPFRCPQPGCQKSYKQANGLKYHMLKGQCNFEVRDAMEWAGLTQEEAEERAKPYACAAGDGCLKRYRQANGLKYHYMNSGIHGEIGLILLAQGQHPMPAVAPTKESKPRPPVNPMAGRPISRGNSLGPTGWVKNAAKASGKELGLPLTGNDDPRIRRGEEAVLFTTQPNEKLF